MKILLAEYATALNVKYFLAQGRCMFQSLFHDFKYLGHQLICPPEGVSDLSCWIESHAPDCDAGLIIAPDDELWKLTRILERHTINLGASSELVSICADKLRSSRLLESHGIPTPRIFNRDPGLNHYILKPRYGSGSQGLKISHHFSKEPGYLCCELIPGEHLSLSLISSKSRKMLISINKQILDSNFKYLGGIVPYELSHEIQLKLRELGERILDALRGYTGYLGVDLVLHHGKPYVVDLNPRMTCSGIGLCKLLNPPLAQLILDSKLGEIPSRVSLRGRAWIMF